MTQLTRSRMMKKEKKWSLAVRCTEEEFFKNLGFLKETPVYHAYLFMLAAAETVYQLERRHIALPLNSRLLREDWLELKELWQKRFSRAMDGFYHGELMDWVQSEMIAPVSEETMLKWGLTDYYCDRVEESADSQLPEIVKDLGCFYRIASKAEGAFVHGAEHFKAKLFGAGIETHLSFDETNGYMEVILVFAEKKLTEEMTFKICQRLPSYSLTTGGMTVATSDGRRKSRYLNVTLYLETPEMGKYLVFESRRGRYHEIADQPQFCMAAADIMRKNGIPVEDDIRLVINH